MDRVRLRHIIGALCHTRTYNFEITLDIAQDIMHDLIDINPYIDARLSKKTIEETLKILNKKSVKALSEEYNTNRYAKILINKDNSIRQKFIREYFKLDIDVRMDLLDVISKYKI